jgi:hypothetical protein
MYATFPVILKLGSVPIKQQQHPRYRFYIFKQVKIMYFLIFDLYKSNTMGKTFLPIIVMAMAFLSPSAQNEGKNGIPITGKPFVWPCTMENFLPAGSIPCLVKGENQIVNVDLTQAVAGGNDRWDNNAAHIEKYRIEAGNASIPLLYNP